MKFNVELGAPVHLHEADDPIGAVRKIQPDHLLVWIEGAGDFIIQPREVASSHDGKLVLDEQRLEPQLKDAIRRAHQRETS